MKKSSLLIATPDREAAATINASFLNEYETVIVENHEATLTAFRKQRFEFSFIDLSFILSLMEAHSCRNHQDTLKLFFSTFPSAPLIIMAPQQQLRSAVDFVRAGAGNYLTYPVDSAELKYVVESTVESDRLESELEYLRSSFWCSDFHDVVKTKSAAMQDVYNKVMAVAPTKTTVLLTGETGTGKGVLARLIHAHSNRKDSLFVSIHCGALSDTLIESELFGHEKGAFTGAIRRKLGKFEVAAGGTVFLDEIGTVSPAVQVKLLQVLQEKTFQRVGGEVDIESDVRIIAATNDDLKQLSDAGRFRRDLYYRLNVFPIELLPLRERVEDIPDLAETFLSRMNTLYNKHIQGIDRQVISALSRYQWPGNIREMEHIVERAYILENGPVLSSESFPNDIFTEDAHRIPLPVHTSLRLAEARRKAIDNFEQQYLRKMLTEHSGRIDRTARDAGISTRQLYKLMKKYGLDKKAYKQKRT